MVKFLFDFYGVLLKGHSPASARHLEEVVRAPDPQLFWRVYEELRPAYDAGLASDQRWWQQVRARAGLPGFDVAAAVEADFGPCVGADSEVVDYVLELVGVGATVGVLSNIPLGLAQRVRARHQWLGCLAAVTLSCDIGLVKPDPQAFAVAVDALGGGARGTLFIDDRADYLAGAAKAGLATHHFRDLAGLRRSVEALRG